MYSWKSSKHFSRRMLTEAAANVIESLESRRLLSGLTEDNNAMVRPTRTIEWEGAATDVVANEWIVALSHHGAPVYDDRGHLIHDGMDYVSAEHGRGTKQQLLDRLGLGLRFRENLGVDHIFTVTAPDGTAPETIRKALANVPGIREVRPNRLGAFASTTPNDTDFSQQWGLSQTSDKDIDAPEAWDYTTGWAGHSSCGG